MIHRSGARSTTIALLHGSPGDITQVEPLAERLVGDFRVVLLELPDHGSAPDLLAKISPPGMGLRVKIDGPALPEVPEAENMQQWTLDDQARWINPAPMRTASGAAEGCPTGCPTREVNGSDGCTRPSAPSAAASTVVRATRRCSALESRRAAAAQ